MLLYRGHQPNGRQCFCQPAIGLPGDGTFFGYQDPPDLRFILPGVLLKKYRDQQAKAAAKETADATAPTQRKRTRAEAIVNSIAMMASKIGDLEFPDFSAEDRAMIIDAMTSMKDTLEPAITRAVKNKKKPM